MVIDASARVLKNVFNVKLTSENENRKIKAVIVNFGDERGDIVVTNDNFGTRRKYPCFTQGKKAAGLHPLQIVFLGLQYATGRDRYINENDEIRYFVDDKQ